MPESASAQAFRGNIDKLISKINDARGIDLSLYRRAYLERRVAARLRTLDLHSYRQYSDLLDSDPEEYLKLLDTITINVTEFFRDKVVWDSMRRNFVDPMIAFKLQGRSRTIRAWSAGCATGEEAYSLSMMLLDALGDDASKFLLSVTATDLDPVALAAAERGVFDVDALKRIPPKYQVRFTKMIGASQFEIAREARERVRFQQFSLFDDPPLRAIDLLVCRNVFIYFDREQQARVIENFRACLARGGCLVLGRSEKLPAQATSWLEPIDGRERIYRKPLRL